LRPKRRLKRENKNYWLCNSTPDRVQNPVRGKKGGGSLGKYYEFAAIY